MARPSEAAGRELLAAIEEYGWFEAEDLEGETDCPEGCVVEPDAVCRHGWEAASLTLIRLVS